VGLGLGGLRDLQQLECDSRAWEAVSWQTAVSSRQRSSVIVTITNRRIT